MRPRDREHVLSRLNYSRKCFKANGSTLAMIVALVTVCMFMSCGRALVQPNAEHSETLVEHAISLDALFSEQLERSLKQSQTPNHVRDGATLMTTCTREQVAIIIDEIKIRLNSVEWYTEAKTRRDCSLFWTMVRYKSSSVARLVGAIGLSEITPEVSLDAYIASILFSPSITDSASRLAVERVIADSDAPASVPQISSAIVERCKAGRGVCFSSLWTFSKYWNRELVAACVQEMKSQHTGRLQEDPELFAAVIDCILDSNAVQEKDRVYLLLQLNRLSSLSGLVSGVRGVHSEVAPRKEQVLSFLQCEIDWYSEPYFMLLGERLIAKWRDTFTTYGLDKAVGLSECAKKLLHSTMDEPQQ